MCGGVFVVCNVVLVVSVVAVCSIITRVDTVDGGQFCI